MTEETTSRKDETNTVSTPVIASEAIHTPCARHCEQPSVAWQSTCVAPSFAVKQSITPYYFTSCHSVNDLALQGDFSFISR